MSAAWTALAGFLDALGRLGSLATLILAAVLAAGVLLQAWGLQRALVRTLVADPRARVKWWRLELRSSLPGLLWAPFGLLIPGVRRLALLLGGWGKKKGKPEPAGKPAAPDVPLVVASLGPTFLVAGIATVAVYLLVRLGELLLAARMGLPGGAPAWQVLLLGRRPEMGLFLPLGRHAAGAATLLAAAFWTTVGWWLARVARIVWQGSLGRNLADRWDDADTLRFWRRWAGATRLVRPDLSYKGWAAWVVAGGVPLLAWAWLSLDGGPLGVRPSEAAVAFVLLLFWAIHLLLRGLERLPAREKAESEEGETQANGWREVLAFLKERLQVAEPLQLQSPRAVEALRFTQLPTEMSGVISPLVLDLLPSGKLTAMQRLVLTDLSLQSFVHVEAPVSSETLELAGLPGEVLQDRSRLRHRNQVVVAPESAGKTTLALLAAANHVLVHTRTVLFVTRDAGHEELLYRRLMEAVEPSTVRWNLRVRQAGGDLMNDLTLGIVPDVVVCSLQRLVVHLLGNADVVAPFLRTLGLIIVDDVESYCGPVEVHARLAFRRLAARLRQLQGVGELGERGAPLVLALGADSMHELPAWTRTLCGVDAVTRDFTRGGEAMEEREAAEGAARGVAARPKEGQEEKPAAGNHQLFYRLRDFRSATGELLSAASLVEVCEHLSVPWAYRPCGDLRRHLGRRPLLLKDEPRCCVDSPEDACVIFLEGRWSDVRRERRRLRRAGARFWRQRRGRGGEEGSVPQGDGAGEDVALITLIDADEDMAFTQLDRRFGLAEILERLPDPALRPPSGRVVCSHLAADLVQHWMEVADVVAVFGHASAPVLRKLARGGLLLTEPRVDVHPDAYEYVRKVYVRALARATAPRLGDLATLPLLPPPVAEVELVSPRSVAVRDRTKPTVPLARVDAAASAFLYYPGRIFTDARGSFQVVGRVLADGGQGSSLEAGDVLAEPILADDVSSPRRQVESRFNPEGAEALDLESSPPEPVLYGRQALRVGVLPVEVRPRHLATLQVGPVYGEVRQRLLWEETGALPLVTAGLWIEPNPVPGDEGLTFGAARLVAAAMRVALASMVRGAAESLEVALRVDGSPAAESPLRPGEGFLVFDLDHGGNGTAASLRRHGVEPLLRLCRLLLERVLDSGRLLALHDHWGDPAELLSQGAPEAESDPRAGLLRHGEVRRQALIWLDSRLRPEGRSEGVPGASGQPEGDFQQGEGDAIDLGRCWFSEDGAVTDLVWAKHRWRVPSGGEAMLDVAFDRATVAAARDFANDAPLLERYRALHTAVLAVPERKLADGTVWGAARAVFLPGDEDKAVLAEDGLREAAVAVYHPLAEAMAAQEGYSLDKLAETLRRFSGGGADGAAGRLDLLRYLARFVQGIPYSIPDALRGGLRPAVSTLLYRLGDCDSKSLLLALLARSCGIDAGLFVSFPERHALAALAAPDASSGAGDGSIPDSLTAWCALAGLSGPPRLWAEMPASPEAGAEVRIYVPVESTVYRPLGLVSAGDPRSWAFLPLTVAPLGLPTEGSGVERKDQAELEDRS